MILLGNMPRLSLLHVFQRIHLHKKTGMLVISQGEQVASLTFRHGQLVHVSLPHEQVDTGDKEQMGAHVQQLLTWPHGVVSFEEAAVAAEASPLELCTTALLPIFARGDRSASGALSSSDLVEEVTTGLSGAPLANARALMNEGPTTPLPASPTMGPLPLERTTDALAIPVALPPHPQASSARKEHFAPPLLALPPRLKPLSGLINAAQAVLPFPDYGPTLKVATSRKPRLPLPPWEIGLVILLVLLAALVHGINEFHYPYYEDDEGTYMAQAWAVVHMGRLAYYTYWYDHAPAGWIQIAGWALITGGFHLWGSAVNAGRVYMLILQMGSTLLLYRIARSISRRTLVAVIVTLLFALSPSAIYFHRRVLLDNIATSWMLLSLALLIPGRMSLKRTWLSALALAVSILSKEVTAFLVPVLAMLVFVRTDPARRWLATIGWLALVVALVSLYPLMALLKNELFPTGTILGGTAPHVSLLGTLQFQAARGKDGGLLSFSSGFWQQMRSWIHDYPVLVGAGSLSALLSLLAIKKRPLMGIMSLLTLSLWAFLGRGGEVIGFYIVPLLPLLALNLGLMLGLLADSVGRLCSLAGRKRTAGMRLAEQGIIVLCLLGVLLGCMSPALAAHEPTIMSTTSNNPLHLLWSGAQADAQNEAVTWIEAHVPTSSHLLIDESMWADLYDAGYHFADYYWKVQDDPAIRDTLYHNDWHSFDYVVTTTQLLTDMHSQHMTLVQAAVDHATPVKTFDTGGWPVAILKVRK